MICDLHTPRMLQPYTEELIGLDNDAGSVAILMVVCLFASSFPPRTPSLFSFADYGWRLQRLFNWDRLLHWSRMHIMDTFFQIPLKTFISTTGSTLVIY